MYTREQIDGAVMIYNDLCRKCDAIEMAGIWKPEEHDNWRLKEILKEQLAEYMMYLSASDGSLSQIEVELLNYITGYEFDPDDVIELISEREIYSERFEERIPIMIQAACVSAVKLERMGVNTTVNGMTLPEQFVFLYKYVGELMIGVDERVTFSERNDFSAYIDRLNNYIYSFGE